MTITRREFAATATGAVAATFAAGEAVLPRPNLGLLLYSYGIRSRVEKDRGFADPVRFAAFAYDRGATAVQLALGAKTDSDAATIRKACEKLGVAVEGIVSPP